MNDRFKFRVWNKEQNRFHHSFCCDITASGTLVISQGIEGKKYIVDDDNYVVQQCTGLKDKNGKLIYEGDIVSIDDGELKGIAQRHDKFDEYYDCIEIKLICKYTTIYKSTVFAESEVIGNIYENKELLNE